MLFLDIIIGILALATLIKASDIFTNEAEKIGLALGVSSFVIGLTVVSIGTSLPEFVTSIMAVIEGQSNFPLDNIIGSNIANSLLIVGISALIVSNLKVKNILIDVDIPFLFTVTILLIYFVYNDKILSLGEGLIFIILLIGYVSYTLTTREEIESKVIIKKEKKIKPKLKSKSFILIFLSAVGIFFGAKYTLYSVETMAKVFEVPSSIITMLGVALGTSLPELVVSIQAVLKGKHGMVIGNIFGSNIFNILLVSGVSVFFGKVTLSSEALLFGIPFLLISLFAFIFSIFDNKVKNWEGFGLLIIYLVYVLKIVDII